MRSIKGTLCFAILCLFACKKSTVDTYTKFKSYRIGYELASAIPPVQLNDGNYITATLDDHGAMLMIQLDAHGNKIWEKNISESSLHPVCFTATNDGDFILSGYDNVSRSSLFATKYNSAGDSLWQVSYNFQPGNANSMAACTASDGNLLLSVGVSSNDINSPATFILKANSSDGAMQYIMALKGIPDSVKCQPLSMVAHNDAVYITGTYYVAQQMGPLLNGSAFILRTNENGDSTWHMVQPPVMNNVIDGIYRIGESVATSADGSTVVVVGPSAPFGYRALNVLPNSVQQVCGDSILADAYDAVTGQPTVTAAFTFEDESSLSFIKNTSDGGYILAVADNFFLANTNSTTHIALTKTDAQLNTQWRKIINLPDAAVMPLGIFQLGDGYAVIAYVVSDPQNNGSYSDLVFLKTDMNGNLTDGN